MVDSNTPLYDGCNPEVTRLSFMLQLLKMKAKNKWTDTSLDEHLKYLKDVLPAGNLCPTSVDEAKKIVCPLDLPHVRYHACINDWIILSEGARGKNKLSGVQCFLIQEGREEMSPESCMVLTDHSPSPAVFR